MAALSRRSIVLALVACVAVSCAGACSTPGSPGPSQDDSVVLPLDLQVRNSGLRGGYLWLAMADHPDTGRWHPFGMAQFMCVTCPRAFAGSGAAYEIAVFDESCQVLAVHQALGGQLLVEIDPGPVIKLVAAPPIGDWLPEDSAPADAAAVPCSPP